VKQPELTSLIGLRDSDGDQLHLVRLDRANGSRAYLMAVGRERVFLTAGDLDRLSTVIRYEVGDGNDDLMAEFRRFFAQAIWLLILLHCCGYSHLHSPHCGCTPGRTEVSGELADYLRTINSEQTCLLSLLYALSWYFRCPR